MMHACLHLDVHVFFFPFMQPADHMAWDMNDMAAVEFIPVVFSLHMLLISLGWFSGERT